MSSFDEINEDVLEIILANAISNESHLKQVPLVCEKWRCVTHRCVTRIHLRHYNSLEYAVLRICRLKELKIGVNRGEYVPYQSMSAIEDKIQDISPLSVLTELVHLDISNTYVTDISPMAGLTSLVHLDISNTDVEDISPLAGLTSLVHLNMKGTDVEDISPLAGLTSLVHLDISNTDVDDISPLAGLTSLTYLKNGWNDV